MAVVTKATYESLSDKIGNAYAAQRGAIPYISSGLTEVVELDDADQEFDLLFSFYTLDANADNVYDNTANLIGVTSALQNHILLRSGKTLDDYLTDEGILVSSDFASVSKDAGFDIDGFIAP
jgi:hypothetical protein